MEIIQRIPPMKEASKKARSDGKIVGFVPTYDAFAKSGYPLRVAAAGRERVDSISWQSAFKEKRNSKRKQSGGITE